MLSQASRSQLVVSSSSLISPSVPLGGRRAESLLLCTLAFNSQRLIRMLRLLPHPSCVEKNVNELAGLGSVLEDAFVIAEHQCWR